jgi:hypothetical protein
MAQPSSSNTKRVQEQVDDVVGIMQNNIDKAIERGAKLENLQSKTGKLNLNPDAWYTLKVRSAIYVKVVQSW